VWVGGSAPVAPSLRTLNDDMIIKFTRDGKFLFQIGGRDKSPTSQNPPVVGGNKDTKSFHQATDVFVYPKTNEAFITDGYGNRRVIVLDADTGAFKRLWGAFGNEPIDVLPAPRGGGAGRAGGAAGGGGGGGRGAAPVLDTEGEGSPQFGSPVHAVKVSNDGLVYVADRPNRRVQVFTPEGKYLKQMFLNRAGPSAQSAAGVAFSPDKEQRFLYVADYGNSHIAVVDRKTMTILYQFGQRSAKPGDFQGIHNMAVDSKGNIYTGEVAPGARLQKFVYKGLSKTLPPNALTAAQLAATP
jgi:DNA-binding beta-propeller fold protein YncE